MDAETNQGITSTITPDERFGGLAFPVIRVRYSSPTDHRPSCWQATLTRDDETNRHRMPYDYALPAGGRQAVVAARELWAKLRPNDEEARVFIPGDLDRDSYVFVVMPSYILSEV